jgi:hypothetical protein
MPMRCLNRRREQACTGAGEALDANRRRDQGGVALLLALVLLTAVTATLAALAPLAVTERLLAVAARDAVELRFAAEAIVEHAVGELQAANDWDAVLQGLAAGTQIDATTSPLVGGSRRINLEALGATLPGPEGGNWGPDEPRWRLFEWGSVRALTLGVVASDIYVAVWVADDQRDGDGNPQRDANGRVLVRGEAFGPVHGRRALVATVARRAPPPAALAVVDWALP